MTSSRPLVSVIIIAYNAERYMREAIDSVLTQTYREVECIIVDDGSRDQTGAIADEYAVKHLNVKVIHQENRGISGARNAGWKASGGELLAFLDADDIFLPEKVERQVAFMHGRQECAVSYVNMKHFYDDRPGELYQHRYFEKMPNDIFGELLHRMFLPLTPVMIRREVVDRVGGFDETLRHSEDWDFWLRVARAGFKFGFLDEDLVRFRLHSESLSRMENQWDMKEHILRIFSKLFRDMKEEERRIYGAERVMARLHFNAAVAYLVAGRKDEFLKHLLAAKQEPRWRVPATLFGWGIRLLSFSASSKIVKRMWLGKQRRLLKLVSHNHESDKEFKSGERFYEPTEWLTDDPVGTAKEHLDRYNFVRELLSGKETVVDAGCGSGYGSKLLAARANKVIGIDKSVHAIEYARAHYGGVNVEYMQADLNQSLPIVNHSVDVAVCFEVVEHVADQYAVLLELRRILKPGGLLIVSTPDKDLVSPDGVSSNPFHLKELTKQEFIGLLSDLFIVEELYGQGQVLIQSSQKEFLRKLRYFSFVRRAKAWFARDSGVRRLLFRYFGGQTYIPMQKISRGDPGKFYILVALCRKSY